MNLFPQYESVTTIIHTIRPEHHDRQFAYIFCILRYVSTAVRKGPIGNESTLVHAMTWYLTGAKTLSEQQ